MATEEQEKAAGAESGKSPDKHVHSFATHQPDKLNMVPGFERIAKLFAGQVQDVLEQLITEKVEVTALETRLVAYQDWCDGQPDFLGMTKFHMPPCKGGMMLGVDPKLISLLVDAFYGGGNKKSDREFIEFTRMESQMFERVTGSFCAALARAWGLYSEFETHVTGHERNPPYAALAGPGDSVLKQSISITFPDAEALVVDLLYAMDAVRYLENLLEPSVGATGDQANPIWQYELQKAMSEVRLPVRSILARTTMTLPQVAEMKPGDIIPIPPVRNLPLIIGEKVFARGSLGEQDGCAAYQIEKMERGN